MERTGKFTKQQIAEYHKNGYVILKSLLSVTEVDALRKRAKSDREMDKHAFQRDDGTGAKVRLSLWNHPGKGIYGMVARSHKLVDSVEQLLEDEVYHYHSKMIMKEAKVGGAWAWHQDYGYWYENGVLSPDLCSVYIAVDAATKENGCLQVLKGSHKMGRVNHVLTGDQAGADLERVEEIKKRLELIYVELEKGDAVFFHSNLLHRSDRNNSENPRWAMICCYNTKTNNPYKESHHPRYTKLEKVPDSAILETDLNTVVDEGAWLDPNHDSSAKNLKTKS
ncbi:phytanoyl-CoA dioxygenase family protein [Maribellus comscasis]|uniref:Phytanoyl-CoA dioxygenase family protein n=1 Tax=Maribellus comscasis TaxID=2681766 RepID=A0A6I6K4C6_9BACT|nr:phytanoyl-CoA dioxygenase family protein [Maribellus comscasis]QGY47477.1 phytanoyl-CoA dioxygenase family protein [Maribellus comscasis]